MLGKTVKIRMYPNLEEGPAQEQREDEELLEAEGQRLQTEIYLTFETKQGVIIAVGICINHIFTHLLHHLY